LGFVMDGLEPEAYDRVYSDRQLVGRILAFAGLNAAVMLVVGFAGSVLINALGGRYWGGFFFLALVNAAGFRTIVPWLRGYGGTQFLSANTLRSGEQAALGQDLLELLDALRIRKAVLAGYDWGGRAACIVAAL